MSELVSRATALRLEGDDPAAIALLDAGLSEDPSDANGWLLLADIHRQNDDSLASLAAFERVTALRPNDPELALLQARLVFDSGLDSVDAFRKAIALAPDNGAARLGLADALVASGAQEQAVNLISQQLGREPGWIEGQVKLAKLRFMAGDQDWSGVFDKAIGTIARQPDAWRERIALEMNAEQYERAFELTQQAIIETGANEGWNLLAATCLDELGKHDAASKLFAILGIPRDHSAAVRLVRHHMRTGNVRSAISVAEPWLGTPMANLFWPYISLAWRLLDDRRSLWLEEQPGLVGTYTIALDPQLLKSLIVRLRSLHSKVRQPIDQSLRGGTQTDGYLLARTEPEFRHLRAGLIEAAKQHVGSLPRRDPLHPNLKHRRDRPLRFSGAWSVRLAQGGYHVAHIHPHGWFSSALYLALPPYEPASPKAGWLELGKPGEELGLNLEPLATVEPVPGRLVLFPSTMWHGTLPFGQGERLTVAFDVAVPV